LRLANISGDGSRNEGSGVVGLEVEHVGENWDFQTEKGVSPLDTLSYATGLFERGLFANATEIIEGATPRGRPSPQPDIDAQ
jgi:hypothetical protein